MSTIIRWSARVIGATMVLVGLVPFTPLVWLLALLRTPAGWPAGVRLHFWQTQGIGAACAASGALLLFSTFHDRRQPPRTPPRRNV